MKRKWIILGVVMMFLLLFSSCGNKSVPEAQVKQDIIVCEEIQNCFSTEYTTQSDFSLESFEITKEQINDDDKEDIVYCKVTIQNRYFKIDVDLQCIYNYYDKGGWILDECMIENMGDVIPVSGPDKELAFEYILDNVSTGGLSSIYLEKDYVLHYGELLSQEMRLYDDYAKFYMQYTSDVLNVNGYYLFEFRDNNWVCILGKNDQPVMYVDNYTSDYSEALGWYVLKSQLFYTGNLNIKNISETSVEYDLQYSMAEDYRVDIDTGNDLFATFDSLSGQFCIGRNSKQNDILFHLTYNANEDQWHMNYYDKFCRGYS